MKTTLRTWNPWQELDQLSHQFEQLFSRQWPSTAKQNRMKFGGVNVLQGDQRVLVQMAVPGFEADDLDISLTHNTLTVKASRGSEQRRNRQCFPPGTIQPAVQQNGFIACRGQPHKLRCDLQQRILSLKLERPAEQQPQKIEVKAL
ncbi:MAG: Hsp20 family protein [Planctomycetaceae bacterium]